MTYLRKYSFAIFFSLAVLTLYTSEAKKVEYSTEPVRVSVAYGSPTFFRFDDDVKTSFGASRFDIRPVDSKNPDYSLLSITPRFIDGSNRVTFVLASGAVVSTIIDIEPHIKENVDSFYDFKSKVEITKVNPKSHKSDSKIALMKAMVREDTPKGYIVKDLSRQISSGSFSLKISLVRVYLGSRYNGYIFKVTNRSKRKSYEVNLEDLRLGKANKALISQTDRNTLEKLGSDKNTTLIRVITRPTTIYYSLNLPFSEVKEEK